MLEKLLRRVRRRAAIGSEQDFRDEARDAVNQLRGQPGGEKLASAFQRISDDDFTPEERAAFDRIEAARQRLETNPEHLGHPFGATTTVGEMARRSSKRPREARVLYAVARAAGPSVGLEIGTCCGVSAAYQAIALAGTGRIVSLEMSPILARTARGFWEELGIGNIDVRVGRLLDLSPILVEAAPDFAFIDGNHYLEPTLSYFEQLSAVCPAGTVMVWDDIEWSDEMREAWKAIRHDSRVAAHARLSGMGFTVLARA